MTPQGPLSDSPLVQNFTPQTGSFAEILIVCGGDIIQDRLIPTMTCFGCGPANPRGLRLKSYLGDGYVTATFMPWPEHDNGLGFLNGGIIATR